MISKKLLTTSIVIGVALAGYFLYRNKPSVLKPEHPPKNDSLMGVPTTSLGEKAKAYSGLLAPKLSEEEKASDCKSSLESIETLPLQTLIYDLSNGRLTLDAKCLFLNKKIAPSLAGFPEVCKNLKSENPDKECIEKLFFYKAARIHQATIGENLDSLQTEVIIHKLIALMMDQSFSTPEGLQLIRQVGGKLYERLPNSDSAAKAAMLGYIGDDNLSEKNKVALDALLTEAREKFPENWEIYEMDLMRLKRSNEGDFKNRIVSFYESNGSSPIGQYYMGCLNWSEGKANAAQEFFRTANLNAPSDKRFSETYQKSMASKPPDKVCSVQIGFNPDNF